jgi:hypothetical protein
MLSLNAEDAKNLLEKSEGSLNRALDSRGVVH